MPLEINVILVTWTTTAQQILTDDKKTYTGSLPLKKTTYYHKNKWQHKHGQYNNSVNQC
jgi:hypothetical protein